MYRYRPPTKPRRDAATQFRRNLTIQTAVWSGVIGAGMMMLGAFTTLPR